MPLPGISDKKVFSGKGALAQLDTLTPAYKNILVFNDRDGFHPCGAADYFIKAEKKFKGRIRYVSYAGKALPLEDIEGKYREVKHNTGVDLIIAVGGGTVIDLAKIISIAYCNRCEKVEEILFNKELENKLDLIFIPTTAGTGSEATSFAVVYKDKVKFSIDNKSLLADYVVLDHLLLKSLPEPVLNATVLDALAQAIESGWAMGASDESREYSKQAIKLILDNIDKKKGNAIDIDRLSRLQMASHLAGKAINISKTTLPHSISYPITSHFGVPHGIAVFLTLPKAAELNYYTTADTAQGGIRPGHIEESFSLLFSLFNVEKIEELIEKLNEIMIRLKVNPRLHHYGITKQDLHFLAANALTKGRSDNNPRKVDSDSVLKLLKEIFL